MTVQTTTARLTYFGDGTTTNFPITFTFYVATDIKVVLGGIVLTSGYSIAGGGTGTPLIPGTGTLIMATPPAAGVIVQIVLDVPLTQLVNLVDGTAFPAATLNQVNDRAVQGELRLQDEINRALRAPDGDFLPNMLLPPAASRANMQLIFGPNGDAGLGTPVAGTITTEIILSLLSGAAIGGLLWPQTAAEAAASVIPTNTAYAPGNVLRYGSNISPGTTDMTAAFQAAFSQATLSGGSPVYAPAGSYLVGTLFYPNGFGFALKGDGPSRTTLIANAINIPVLQKAQTAGGSLDYAHFSDFSIQAAASAVTPSTTTAFDCSGLRSSVIEQVFGLSNAIGIGFKSVFSLSASPYLCYGNRFSDCGLAQQAGWTKVWDFSNGGTANALHNANATHIVNPWVYQNTGLNIGIDAQRSANTSIIGGLFEQNPGATAINSGQLTTIQNVWIELNAHTISYNAAADGTANSGLVLGCYFSSPDTISFAGCQSNIWIGNVEPGTQTWTNNNGTNVRLKVSTDAIVAPTISQTSGATGTLSFGSATLLNQSQLTNEFTYALQYNWTPGISGGFTAFTVATTNNYTVQQLSVGMTLNANGVPAATAVGSATTFSVSNTATTDFAITALVTIKPRIREMR